MSVLADAPRIAIIQTAYLGDVALVLHLVANVRERFPGAYILLVVRPEASEIAALCHDVDEVLSFDKRDVEKGLRGVWRLARGLRKRRIDCVLAPHRSLRTALCVFFAGVSYSYSFANAPSGSSRFGALLYLRSIPYPYHLHEIERNDCLLQAFANDIADNSVCDGTQCAPEVSHRNSLPRLSLPTLSYLYSTTISQGMPPNLVLIAPGSRQATKRWHKEHYITLAQMLIQHGIPIGCIGGKEDEHLCKDIAAQSGCWLFAGMPIASTLALLRSSALLISNDSAPVHLASLVGCPTVAIFGPTLPRFGFAPRALHSIVLEQTELPCRPCSWHGGRQCHMGTHECMNAITPHRVWESVQSIMHF